MGRWTNGSICGWVVLWGQVGLCVRVPKEIRRSALSVDFAHGDGVDSDALAECASSPWNHIVKLARYVDPAKRRRLIGKGNHGHRCHSWGGSVSKACRSISMG